MMIYTIQELADAWRVHHSAIRRLIKNGSLKAFRVGNQWRIPEESVKAYIDNHHTHEEDA
jgi:excisionase family DNA binding protein